MAFFETLAGQRFIATVTDGVRQIRRLNTNIEKLLEVHRGAAEKGVPEAVDLAVDAQPAGQTDRSDRDAG